MTPVKVHSDLKSVDRHETYHLGHYEVTFADGPVRFQLHANICGEVDCPCDNILFTWLTEGSTFKAWYSAERDWSGEDGKPLAKELVHVFGIVEDTDVFRQRYSHLVYLRRVQILAETDRLKEPFQVTLPKGLLDDEEGQAIAGRVSLEVAGETAERRYELELCGDPTCYCRDIFLILPELPGPPAILINPVERWLPADESTDESLVEQVHRHLAPTPQFAAMIAALRHERRLQNYHRYVHAYPGMDGLSV